MKRNIEYVELAGSKKEYLKSDGMKFIFVCVNYNSEEETKKYIDNVLQLDYCEEAFVIAVDNSPTDESFNQLNLFVKERDYSERQVALLRRDNRGYFQGLNDGILYAKELGFSEGYFIVGNNDIIFKKNFISALKSIKIDEKTLVLAPDIITNDGSHENPHVLQKMSFLRKLKYDFFFFDYRLAKLSQRIKNTDVRPFKPHDPIRKEIYMGIGALYVLTPYFFEHFEILSEEVFLYGEEAILTGQLQSVNARIMYEPSLVCYHNESSTTSKMESVSKYHIIQKSYKIYRKYL